MERSQFLQMMRFVAAALVLCTHATFYYHERISSAVAVWHWGEVGVPLFFAISGVVMVASTQSLRTDAHGAREFIMRRIVRIVPLWWLAVFVKIVIALARPEVVNHNHFQLDYAIKSLLFIPYFNEQHAVVPLHGVGWTLLHELYFYVLFSAAMLAGRRPALDASLVIAAVWLLGRFVRFDNPFWSVAASTANLQFIFGMAVGSLLVLPADRRSLRGKAAGSLATLAVGLMLLPSACEIHYAYPVVLTFGATTILLADVELPRPLQALSQLGDSSYSLYLFHPFLAPACILGLGALAPGWPAALNMGLAVLVTIAAAHVLHKVVEKPLVRFFRDRLVKQRRQSTLAAKQAS